MIDFIIPVFIGIVWGVVILHAIDVYRAWREIKRKEDELSKKLDKLDD